MKKLLIIDTLNLLFRSYYAMKNLSTKDAHPTGMIFGLLNFLLKLKNELEFNYVIFALDCSGGSFRKELLPAYKANRKEAEEELKIQIPICIDIIKKSGFLTLEKEKFEADDIIASLAKKARENNIFTTIYSTDKDLYQLIDDDFLNMLGKDYEQINEQSCLEKFGVSPAKMVDYLALVGDSADNFKGVPGIGPKAAQKLLNDFKSIDDIYKNLNSVANKNTQTKLLTYKDDAILSLKLAKLVDSLDFGDIFSAAKMPSDNFFTKIIDEINKYELYKFLKEAKSTEEPVNKPLDINLDFKCILIDDEKTLEQIVNNLKGEIGFDTETTGLNIDDKIVGFSFCSENLSYYVPILHKNAKNISTNAAVLAIKKIFEHTIIGHNLKFDFKMLKANFNISIPAKYFDSMIAAWLLNPSDKFSLDALALKYLNYECINFEDIVKKNEKFSDIDINIAYKYAAQDAFITKALFNYINEKLDKDLQNCQKSENTFIKVLVDMESNGIRLSKAKLLELKEILELDLANIEQEVFKIAGATFNLNSPIQLKDILYKKLNLSDFDKGSTKEATLAKINHPITEYILEYRTASKVLNTYVLPLLALNKNDSDFFIVRSNFMQTGTATGRLSSNNPNLQNIPTKSKYANALKQAFVARDGYSYLSLDYSQIELRMLAHFSKDESLLKSFLDDEDIHARTALEIFGEVDKEKRNFAKSINFGLIYGMGARRLASELDLSYSKASEYIKKYFDAFTNIKEYFENTKKQTKDTGYIKTLIGRKRFFKYSNSVLQNNANDRECINSILQGSAADLIKLAMIKIYPYLNDFAKLILQIHDELIFEVKDEYLDEFLKIVKNIMENAHPLNVKIKTNQKIGKNWSQLK